jgi:predicted ATPase
LEGWFSLEQAAETVFTLEDGVNDPFDAVFELVDKSLVSREVRQGEPLFRLSELTRAYAQMKPEDKRADAIASDL